MDKKENKNNTKLLIPKKSFFVNEELSELLTPHNLKRGYKIKRIRDLLLEELELTENWEKDRRKYLASLILRYTAAPSQFKEFGKYVGDVYKKEYIKEKIKKYGFKFEDIDIKPDNLRINVSYEYTTIEEASKYGKRTRLLFKLDIIGNKHIFCVRDNSCEGEVISQILSTWQYFKESKKIYDYIVLAPRFPFEYYNSYKAVESLVNIKNIILVLDEREFSYRNINKDDLDWEREKQDYIEEVKLAGGLDKDIR